MQVAKYFSKISLAKQQAELYPHSSLKIVSARHALDSIETYWNVFVRLWIDITDTKFWDSGW